jgi:hypothetical protein
MALKVLKICHAPRHSYYAATTCPLRQQASELPERFHKGGVIPQNERTGRRRPAYPEAEACLYLFRHIVPLARPREDWVPLTGEPTFTPARKPETGPQICEQNLPTDGRTCPITHIVTSPWRGRGRVPKCGHHRANVEDSRSSCTSGTQTSNCDCFSSIYNLQPTQLTASVAGDEATLQ